MAGCNLLYIDAGGLLKAIQDECYQVLNEVADRIIKEFGQYIVAAGAGRTKWRENAAKEFKIISDKASEDMLEIQLGLREGLEAEAWSSFYAAQIMVALFGNHPENHSRITDNGSKTSHMTTKPGELTFHDHMENIDESHATTVWELPEGFNWDDPHADKMLENSMKRAEQQFKDGLRQAFSAVRFSDFLFVSGG